MAYLRHASRHIQESILDALEARLTFLHWIAADNTLTPFGASPVVYQRRRMEESELKAVTGNLVAVSFGQELDDLDEELGGGLLSVEMPVFVDCIAEKENHALLIAADVKDFLAGRAPGTSRYLRVHDKGSASPATPVDGWLIELTDVIREQPDTVDWRARWQAVKATAYVTFPGGG